MLIKDSFVSNTRNPFFLRKIMPHLFLYRINANISEYLSLNKKFLYTDSNISRSLKMEMLLITFFIIAFHKCLWLFVEFELNRTWHRINSKTNSNKKGVFHFPIFKNKGNTKALLRTHYCESL